MDNSFHITVPWYAKERCHYKFIFLVGAMSIRLSEEERNDLTGVYTWVMPDLYVGLESVKQTKIFVCFCIKWRASVWYRAVVRFDLIKIL